MWLKIILIFIAIMFILTLIVKRFAYYKPSYEFMAPKDSYEDLYLGNLHAWYKPGKTGKVILFCHGNSGNLSNRQDKLIELSKMGHSVLIFDYSGFGQSRGIPSEQLCYNNASTFVEYLSRKGYKKENIIPYGESLGAAVAAYIARRYNLPMIIIESGLPSIKTLLKSWSPLLSMVGFIFYEFDTVSYLRGYKGRSLVLHPVHDEVVSYKIISEMVELSTEHIGMEGTHNSPQIPWNKIQQFIGL